MKIVTKSASLAALLVLMLVPAVARAQESRLTLSFTPAVAAASGDTQLALAGTAAYRFSEHFSFESDVTWIDGAAGGFRDRNLSFDLPVRATGVGTSLNTLVQGTGIIFGGGGNRGGNDLRNFPAGLSNMARLPSIGTISAATDGQTWIGTMGVRYEPGVQTARFRPYVSAGLGLNHTTERFSLGATSFTQAAEYSASRSGVAFSAGGGANVHLGGALWLAADAKYFHLSLGEDLMRLGGGVTFKF